MVGANIFCNNAECPVEPSMFYGDKEVRGSVADAIAAWNNRKFFKVTVW